MDVIIAGRWNRHCSSRDETKALWRTRNRFDRGETDGVDLREKELAVSRLILSDLEDAGATYVTDGGIRWDSVFDVARAIHGCRGFAQLTRIPGTNHFHRQPEATPPFSVEMPLLLEDFEQAQDSVEHPIVLSLPGPYTMARQTRATSVGFQELVFAYAKLFNEELRTLLANGVTLIRIEEPQILQHPEDWTMFVLAMNRLTAGVDCTSVALATWYGTIQNPQNYFSLPFGWFHIDFVEGEKNERILEYFPKDRRLIAGIVDARHPYTHPFTDLHCAIQEIARYVALGKLAIAPHTDLHFLPWDVALEKVRTLAYVAKFSDGTGHTPLHIAEAKEWGTVKTNAVETGQDTLSFRQKLSADICVPIHTVPRTLFPTSAVGSYPQHPEMRVARAELRRGQISAERYVAFVASHVRRWMEFQHEIEITVPVAGEFFREDMAVAFGAGFGGKLADFVPSYENRRYRPVVYDGKVVPAATEITVSDFLFAQSLTDRPVKETITGPVTLAHWALLQSPTYYGDPEQFRVDLARALRAEVNRLIRAGVRILQVDEPALTTNMDTFAMDCMALDVLLEALPPHIYTVLHLCYSDMGALDRAFPRILGLPFNQIHMEVANRGNRVFELIRKHEFGGKDIGLGVTDVHTDRIETVEDIVESVRQAREFFAPEQIWLLPDCGLKERSDDVAQAKLRVMCEAAVICRETLS